MQGVLRFYIDWSIKLEILPSYSRIAQLPSASILICRINFDIYCLILCVYTNHRCSENFLDHPNNRISFCRLVAALLGSPKSSSKLLLLISVGKSVSVLNTVPIAMSSSEHRDRIQVTGNNEKQYHRHSQTIPSYVLAFTITTNIELLADLTENVCTNWYAMQELPQCFLQWRSHFWEKNRKQVISATSRSLKHFVIRPIHFQRPGKNFCFLNK